MLDWISKLATMGGPEVRKLGETFLALPAAKQAKLMEAAALIPDDGYRTATASVLLNNLEHNANFLEWMVRVLQRLSPGPFDKFVDNFLIGTCMDNHRFRQEYQKEHGFESPVTVVINPTMRCNLRCTGCYAYNFSKAAHMEEALLRKILDECRRLHIRFLTISGGEPFLHPRFVDLAEEYSDLLFMTYTNGTRIDRDLARRLARAGNIWPAISVEGYEAETDGRRGKGVFAKVLAAMEHLREEGVMFGFSATPTSRNTDVVATDDFIDFYIERGALFGWMFTYMPVGRDPDLALMATPEQRDRLRAKSVHWKRTKPILIGDFWNDGACVGGCLSGGRYLYITADGLVQPCTFVHFYTTNIRDGSIEDALRSDFFRAIRAAQPYHPNLLRPCKIIDNPEVLRDLVRRTEARPTYEGADHLLRDPHVRSFLDDYARRWGVLADAAWAGPDYQEGRSVVVPLLGRIDVHQTWPDRMARAGGGAALSVSTPSPGRGRAAAAAPASRSVSS